MASTLPHCDELGVPTIYNARGMERATKPYLSSFSQSALQKMMKMIGDEASNALYDIKTAANIGWQGVFIRLCECAAELNDMTIQHDGMRCEQDRIQLQSELGRATHVKFKKLMADHGLSALYLARGGTMVDKQLELHPAKRAEATTCALACIDARPIENTSS